MHLQARNIKQNTNPNSNFRNSNAVLGVHSTSTGHKTISVGTSICLLRSNILWPSSAKGIDNISLLSCTISWLSGVWRVVNNIPHLTEHHLQRSFYRNWTHNSCAGLHALSPSMSELDVASISTFLEPSTATSATAASAVLTVSPARRALTAAWHWRTALRGRLCGIRMLVQDTDIDTPLSSF